MGWSKLYAEIVTSSIWSADDKTRLVWVTLLALKDQHGFIPASIPGLANAARVSVEDCEMAVEKLEGPDKYSRTPDHDGRRIAKVDGGWKVLNHFKYRDGLSSDPKAESARERMRRMREKRRQEEEKKEQKADTDTDTDTGLLVTGVTGVTKLRKAFEKPTLDEVKAHVKDRSSSVDPERFWNYYESNGWRVGKNPMKSWKSAIVTWEKGNASIGVYPPNRTPVQPIPDHSKGF